MDEATTATGSDHEAERLRGPKRLLLIGPVVSLVLAAAAGLLGADGATGLLLFLLLLAVTFGGGGLWVGIGLLLDEFRGEPTSLRRTVVMTVLFAATLVCMVAIGGLATSMEAGS